MPELLRVGTGCRVLLRNWGGMRGEEIRGKCTSRVATRGDVLGSNFPGSQRGKLINYRGRDQRDDHLVPICGKVDKALGG